MAYKIENTPSPSVLMNSMRSIGYTFKTALADIVDNSISASAKNVYISVPINDDDLYVTILDDGKGMSRNDLFNAMKYGSDRKYTTGDLGRFGLGLKSASLSQCRILTVISKNDSEISAFQWNLDSVIQDKKWDCIELETSELTEVPCFEKLADLQMGTLVVWQNFDIAYRKSSGRVREYLSDEMADAEKHLRLVFHRFLSNKFKPFKIFVNNDSLEPFDPFLEDHPKTDSKKVSEITVEGETIKIQPFILPHMADLTDDDINKIGGIEALRNEQGFYIYRNDRLIIYGKWFRLSSASVSPELLKYGRIKVDIPNTLDEIWDIDIKKQNATIPRQVLNYLKKAVSDVCYRSKEKTTKRARLTLERDDDKIWNKTLDKQQTVALKGWSGPEPTHKDFSYGDDWFEIKTINSFKSSVFISSIEQLDSENEGKLVIYRMEKMSPSFNGVSLNILVGNIMQSLDLDTDKDIFVEKLKQVGYAYNEVYDNYVYNFISMDSYSVRDGFPRIKAEQLAAGIGKVQYEVLISLIEKYKETL